MMLSEGKLVARLRKRRARMIAYSLLLAVVVPYAVFIAISSVDLRNRIAEKEVAISIYSAKDSSIDMAMLSRNLRKLARMERGMLLMCPIIVILIAALIAEARGATHSRMIAALWDRVRKLEKRIQPEGTKPCIKR